MINSWNNCNKPYWVARQFLTTIQHPFIEKGRPSAEFFRLYGFFRKVDGETLNLLHVYLEATGKQALSMRDLFHKAMAWNTNQRTAVITKTQTNDYLALLRAWKD